MTKETNRAGEGMHDKYLSTEKKNIINNNVELCRIVVEKIDKRLTVRHSSLGPQMVFERDERGESIISNPSREIYVESGQLRVATLSARKILSQNEVFDAVINGISKVVKNSVGRSAIEL